MTLSDVSTEHVELAMHEADELGRAAFLGKYGFGYATTYLVRHRGRFYDPKALVAAAHGFTDRGEHLQVNDLDATEAIAHLRKLLYEVVPFKGLWWVNQGSTYRQELAGGYLWAPKVTKSGHPVAHHVAVSKLREGQLVVHYSGGSIRAVSHVVGQPRSTPKPDELTGDAWGTDGYGCQVVYRVLDRPIPRDEVPDRGPDVGPFDRNGDVKQGYLFPVENAHTFALLEFLNERIAQLFEQPEAEPLVPFREEAAEELPNDPIHDLLLSAKNVVLEGVPGTGKSYAIERLADEWSLRTGRELVSFSGKPFAAQVMHPSTSYEDFMEGLRPRAQSLPSESRFFDEPVTDGGQFVVDDGFFLRVCASAVANPAGDVLVLIDELNRCNVSSVLGDLLLTVEASRRARFQGQRSDEASASDWDTSVPVRLPYSGRIFFVPDNVYVVATTNTTDRSVAPLDQAIRRRFAFYRIEPELDTVMRHAKRLPSHAHDVALASATMLSVLNDAVLAPCLGPDAMLGPSYIFGLVTELETGAGKEAVDRVWRFSILPQLIDLTRSYGAEGMLDPSSRGVWFAEHGSELTNEIEAAQSGLNELDVFLASVGVRIAVEGTGLARGARVLEATQGRVDVAQAPVDVELALGETADK